MAVDAAGAVTVAWATEGTSLSLPTVLVSRCTFAASTWTVQARLDQASSSGVGPPVVAADAAGRVTVAWVQDSAPHACRYDITAGAWSTPERLGVSMQDGLTGLGIGVDVAGNLTLALTGFTSTTQVALRFSASDHKWSAANSVVSPSAVNDQYAHYPAAAVAPSGDIVLAWFALLNPGLAGRYAVRANRFRCADGRPDKLFSIRAMQLSGGAVVAALVDCFQEPGGTGRPGQEPSSPTGSKGDHVLTLELKSSVDSDA